ncbi:hypothetical protein ACFL3C_03655 [Patescibacteria group bacterium]
MDKSQEEKNGRSLKSRGVRFATWLGNVTSTKRRSGKIISGIFIAIIAGLTCYLFWSQRYIKGEISSFRKTVESKKILSTIRKECKKNPDLGAYNKCLNSKLTASVDLHASKLYAKLKSICSYNKVKKFPYCVQSSLRKFAWDSKDLVLKLIAMRVIDKLEDPPKDLKDDADKYYGDAVKLERKGRLVFITPVCPCKSKPSKKPTP